MSRTYTANARKVLGVIPAYNPERAALEVFDEYLETFDRISCTTIVFPLTTERRKIDDLLGESDALLIVGGGDIEPRFHTSASAHESLKGLCPPLDRMGIEVARKAYRHGIPTLGTCRGMQIMNVALGGTLWQDLPSEYPRADGTATLPHQQEKPFSHPSHRVCVADRSLLAECIGPGSHAVNSMHHQGVRELAPCMVACARAEDGLIEGIEAQHEVENATSDGIRRDREHEAELELAHDPCRGFRETPLDVDDAPSPSAYAPAPIVHPFFLGIQWHPEFLEGRQSLVALIESMLAHC